MADHPCVSHQVESCREDRCGTVGVATVCSRWHHGLPSCATSMPVRPVDTNSKGGSRWKSYSQLLRPLSSAHARSRRVQMHRHMAPPAPSGAMCGGLGTSDGRGCGQQDVDPGSADHHTDLRRASAMWKPSERSRRRPLHDRYCRRMRSVRARRSGSARRSVIYARILLDSDFCTGIRYGLHCESSAFLCGQATTLQGA